NGVSDTNERLVEFDRLNPLGKAVYMGGAAVRFAADLIEVAVNRAATIYVEAEKAFKQGYDADVEDAKVIDEE
ncbi:MAG: hypothetical protein WED81_07170, partial [Rhodothermales bacterium]